MTIKQRANIEAALGTIIFMILLFLLLWFVYLAKPELPEDEGIEVAFGVAEEGGGYEEQQSEVVPVVTTPPPSAPSQPSAPSTNDLITQEDEESLAIARQREQDKKRREEELANAERERRERAEAEARAEAERKAREQAEAEQRAREEAAAKAAAEKAAKEQAAKDKAAALGSLFGNNGSESTGSGDSTGNDQKGNPVGHGSIGGNEWSLSGRGARAIPKPANNFNQEGKVIITIRVDGAGNVIDAKQTGGNISDAATIQLAIDAAYKAKFTPSDNAQQVGTITYKFKFN